MQGFFVDYFPSSLSLSQGAFAKIMKIENAKNNLPLIYKVKFES